MPLREEFAGRERLRRVREPRELLAERGGRRAERDLDPPRAPEQIHRQRKRRALDALEEKRRTASALARNACHDLRDLELRIDGDAYTTQLARGLERRDESNGDL